MTLVISKGLTLDNGTRAAAIAGVSPTLDYRFAREKREIETVSLTDKLTYTGGNGTFVGSDGFIQRATTNVPRFDHDPLSRQSLGLLTEGSRQNLLLRSEEFNQSAWVAAAFSGGTIPTVTANAAIAPNGMLTADQVFFPAESGSTQNALQQAVALTVGISHTISFWARTVSGTVPNLLIRIGATEQALGQTITTEWNRYSLTLNPISASDNVAFKNRPSTSGNGAAMDLYLWGAQLEVASTPSTYIPTTSSAVTRTADSAVIDGTGVLTGTYTMVEKPAGCAVVSGTNINLEPGFTAERVMVFPAALDAGQITAIRGAM
jgi:hypothetical protein